MRHVSCLVCGTAEGLPVLTLRPDAHRRLNPATAAERVRFVACRHCGFIYQTPRFTREELRPIYAEEYRRATVDAEGVPSVPYLEFARAKSRREFEWLAARLTLGARGRVLEVGCATGQLLRLFTERGWQAIGVEPTRIFAEYGSRAHGLPIIPALFEEAELPPGFDLVILSQVLEHVEDPAAVLGRAAALLGPAGRLYVSVPYFAAYLPIRPARELFVSTHLFAFSPASLLNLASRCRLAADAVGTLSRYLCALLHPEPAVASRLEREDPRAVRRRVRALAFRYLVLHDSRFLAAEWTKRRLRALLGEAEGERVIDALRRLKHRLGGGLAGAERA
jgi:SAM-dependent methyltransferase